MNVVVTPDDVEVAKTMISLREKLSQTALIDQRAEYESNFGEFFRGAWSQVYSAPYQKSWAVDAVCEHLEAVTLGHIPRLLINIPPRCAKTTVASVCWNGWIWARSEISFLSGPQVKFLSGSYNSNLSLQNSNKTRRLLMSPWYQKYWGDRFHLRLDQNTKSQFDNTSGGSRIATSVRGSLLGLGGDVICVDDPHNTETEKKVETDADRRAVAGWWQELSSTRLNDPKQSVMAIVMQRLHSGDLSGIILKAMENDEEDWVHLMIPMEFDAKRPCVTVILPQFDYGEDEPTPWQDPRIDAAIEEGHDGQLMWPERFGTKEIERMKRRLGPFMAAGRMQQSPIPKGGGIIDRDWWETWNNAEASRYGLVWTAERKEFPPCELIVGSVDTSYGEKEENSLNAMTVWGVWVDRLKNRRAMLMFGWQRHAKLHGKLLGPHPNEGKLQFQERQKKEWGLVEWVADTCKRYGVQRLLIENKTRGRDVANELIRQYARENYGIQLLEPCGDKVSRTHSVVPMFTDGMIWAPVTKWSEEVITDTTLFPKGEHNDLHDTVTQFLNWARENEILILADEMSAALEDMQRYQGPPDDTVANQYGI